MCFHELAKNGDGMLGAVRGMPKLQSRRKGKQRFHNPGINFTIGHLEKCLNMFSETL
jgi:hypothetical protein